MTAAGRVPWLRYRDTGLFAVPSAHNRLVFAQLVLEACLRQPFDVIAVEAPASFNADGTLDAMARIAPHTGLVIERLESEDAALVTPITPSDSIVTALRCPRLLAGRWPGWRPHVIAIDAEFTPARRRPTGVEPPDDYEVRVAGLEAFCRRWKDAWASGRDEEADGPRERAMASRLSHFLSEGRTVLFVCGAAHWSPVEALLDAGIAPERVPRRTQARAGRLACDPRSARRVALLDPALAWLWGWLDDIPRLVWAFETAVREGRAGTFDKPGVEASLLRTALRSARREGLRISARRLVHMTRFHAARLGVEGRWTAELDAHLVAAALSCVGEKYSKFLKRYLCEFPALPPAGVPLAAFSLEGDTVVLEIDGERFVCSQREGNWDTGRRLPLPAAPTLTPAERAMRNAPHVYRDWPAEALLHNRLIARARDLAHAERDAIASRPWDGTLGLGLDVRRTVRAIAAGDRRLRLRHRRHSIRAHAPCTGLCPVVWIFTIDRPVTGHFAGFVPKEAGSHASLCLSAFYWLLGSRTLGESGIQRFDVAYTVSLTRGAMPLDTPRTAESIRRAIDAFPPNRLARIAPWHDVELGSFKGHEQALAAAIKYADDHIVVVSAPDIAPGAHLRAFAAARHVRIITVSRDRFEPAALERLALDHNVPAPSQFQDPFPWCERFIEPMEP